VTYLADATAGSIKVIDIQIKGQSSTVCFTFASIEEAIHIFENVSNHSVYVHVLCNKNKTSSSSSSSGSSRVKLKDIFNISAAFDLIAAKMKYLPHFSSFNSPTKPISDDKIDLESDILLTKFLSSTDTSSGGHSQYKRLVLQPRSPDLPSSLPPMNIKASVSASQLASVASSSSSLLSSSSSPPVKANGENDSELVERIPSNHHHESSLSSSGSIILSESFTDLNSLSLSSPLDLAFRNNRFDYLDEDDARTDFDTLLADENEASYVSGSFRRSGDRELHAEDFTCPITREIIQTAMRSKYGHYYERGAILEWVSTRKQCPLTKLPLELNDLAPSSTRYDVCLRRFQKERVISTT